MEIIFIIYRLRFIILAVLIVISLFFSFVGSRVSKKVALSTAISATVFLAFLIIRVETASPFSKPSVSERQVELLISEIDNNPAFVSKVLLKDIRGNGDEYVYVFDDSSVTICVYNKDTYYESYDVLKRTDIGIGYFEAPDNQSKDYSTDWKSNGYIEKKGKDGVTVKCYPVFFLSPYKFSSIYVPFEPGGYCEEMVIEYKEQVIVLFSGAEFKKR